ncbi:MAG: SAM-dependent methyltransferase [Legionellales bacterium]|nr:SAM-dependent methyltransferase [Legionellales bacterium]
MQLPKPSTSASAHSEELSQLIREKIQQEHFISFYDFMQMALYQPGLGYYHAGLDKFGAVGDFITAPEISRLFGQCLAQQFLEISHNLDDACIFEFGAGTGKLCFDILTALQKHQALPKYYYILEISPDLRQRQQQLLSQFPQVIWLDTLLEKPMNGLIIANEVLDAMPIQRFHINNQIIYEMGVTMENNQFKWHLYENPTLTAPILSLFNTLPNHYSSEINLNLSLWCASLFQQLHQGVVLLIDYGFSRQEYYHPQRNQGTLMCHYRHLNHDDPFYYPGLQDITAHVDFTTLAYALAEQGFTLEGFLTQANYLLNLNILNLAQENHSTSDYDMLKLSQEIQRLLMPHEMGELFKVLIASKQYSHPLSATQKLNQLSKLTRVNHAL